MISLALPFTTLSDYTKNTDYLFSVLWTCSTLAFTVSALAFDHILKGEKMENGVTANSGKVKRTKDTKISTMG